MYSVSKNIYNIIIISLSVIIANAYFENEASSKLCFRSVHSQKWYKGLWPQATSDYSILFPRSFCKYSKLGICKPVDYSNIVKSDSERSGSFLF